MKATLTFRDEPNLGGSRIAAGQLSTRGDRYRTLLAIANAFHVENSIVPRAISSLAERAVAFTVRLKEKKEAQVLDIKLKTKGATEDNIKLQAAVKALEGQIGTLKTTHAAKVEEKKQAAKTVKNEIEVARSELQVILIEKPKLQAEIARLQQSL